MSRKWDSVSRAEVARSAPSILLSRQLQQDGVEASVSSTRDETDKLAKEIFSPLLYQLSYLGVGGQGSSASIVRWSRLVDRFVGKVAHRGGEGDCWLWTGSKDKDGYGWFTPVRRRTTRAHRFAYLLTRGAIPAGMVVMHICNTPACVRPDHLAIGTQAENIAQRDRDGRTSKGDRHYKRRVAA